MAAIEDRRSELGEELERLYEEHGGRVRAICLGLLRDRDEAEDAAQQVFLSALRSLHNGTDPRDAGAWLATIARHECWARARRPAVAPLHDGLHDLKAQDPSTSALSRAELDETWRSVAALPGRQREVLLLREVRGLGYDELAEGLELSRPSVRSLLMRARRTLRAELERGAAVLTGGPWLNTFERLFADGSNPALSSVTRTAAVGLGAVAITGGAVVAPQLVAPTHAHRASAHASRPRASHRPPRVASPPAVDRAPARTDAVVRKEESHRGSSSSGGGSDRVAGHDQRGHDGSSTSSGSSGSGSPSPGSSGRDGGGSGTSTRTSGDSSEVSSSGPSSEISGSEGPGTVVTTVSSSGDGGSSTGRDGSGSSDSGGSSDVDGGSSGPDGGGSGSDGG